MQSTNLDIFYDVNWDKTHDEYQHIQVSTWYTPDGSNIVDRLYVSLNGKALCEYDNETKECVLISSNDCHYLDYRHITREVAEILELSHEYVMNKCLLYLIPFE